MRIKYTLMLALGLIMASPANAQKRQKSKAKNPPVQAKKEPTAADLLYENMLSSIQDVMVVDSIVVAKDDFVSHIPLPLDCGTLLPTASLLNNDQKGAAFVNEFGNKAYFSVNDEEGQSRLLTSDKLQNRWSAPTAVEGIDQALSPDYPFMMADGVTLYFAQKGEESLGGYDIFVTRYDSEDGRFFHPENIGLPFNSRANDYLYIEDELDELGWLVTDRNQEEGMVCIYTFVPTKKRVNIDTDELEDGEIESRASIGRIKDTWGDDAAYQAAVGRLQSLRERNSASAAKRQEEAFVVTDGIAYTSAQQFRSDEARRMFKNLQDRKAKLEKELEQLEAYRMQYHNGNSARRRDLQTAILQREQLTEELRLAIKQLEKLIRNAEIKSLQH